MLKKLVLDSFHVFREKNLRKFCLESIFIDDLIVKLVAIKSLTYFLRRFKLKSLT